MDEQQSPDRRGTFWDWPTGWLLAGVLILVFSAAGGAQGGVAIGWLLVIFGGISMAIRRGAFSPRQRP